MELSAIVISDTSVGSFYAQQDMTCAGTGESSQEVSPSSPIVQQQQQQVMYIYSCVCILLLIHSGSSPAHCLAIVCGVVKFRQFCSRIWLCCCC